MLFFLQNEQSAPLTVFSGTKLEIQNMDINNTGYNIKRKNGQIQHLCSESLIIWKEICILRKSDDTI